MTPPPEQAAARPPRARRAWISLVAAVALALLGYATGAGLYRFEIIPGSSKPPAAEVVRGEIRAQVELPWTTSLGHVWGRNFLVFVILCLGIGSAGILTAVQIFWLGVSVGIDVSRTLAAGIDGRVVFWFLFPHGVPEIAGFLLAGSIGLHGAVLFLRYMKGGALVEPGDLRPILPRALVAFGLLAVAGLIEVFLTPVLGARYL